jgi:hypothetical protein
MTEQTGPEIVRRCAALEAYMRERARDIGLGDWTIVVLTEPAEDEDEDSEVFLNVTIDVGRRATVRAHERFWGRPREEHRHLAVHELCHLPAERCAEAFALVKTVLPARLIEPLKTAFENAEEHMVEWAAQQLAPRFPLPEFTTTEPTRGDG